MASVGVGVPLEVLYFVSLGLALNGRSAAPRGWYWRPFDHHSLLSNTARGVVLPFYYGGAVAFVAVIAGALLVVLAMLAELPAGA